jgi:hypothetical protein
MEIDECHAVQLALRVNCLKHDCFMVNVGHALKSSPIVVGDTDGSGPTQIIKKCVPFGVSNFKMQFPSNLNSISWCRLAKLISSAVWDLRLSRQRWSWFRSFVKWRRVYWYIATDVFNGLLPRLSEQPQKGGLPWRWKHQVPPKVR